ncbi:MAG: alpha/beta hydrolase [Actinobacteria bacterium]|nr:alpha/beta hydrolase [Actinomycetota bacterium]MCL5069504.1 alpha/beta hydrolase [Actinomycetota bacterium]
MKLYSYANDIKTNLKIREVMAFPDIGKPPVGFKKYILEYDSPYRTGIKENDSVYAELFLGKNDKLLVFVHGFAANQKKIVNYNSFIYNLVNKGFNCAFINLPFHLNRAPGVELSGQRLISYDDKETLLFFHQSVVDIRKLIDISLDLLPLKKIIICGVSLGTMVSVISMSCDSRISKGIFLIGGGNWNEIHWKGFLRFLLKGNCSQEGFITKEKCSQYYTRFPDFLKDFKEIKIEDLTWDLENYPELKQKVQKMCFLCDPVAFANKINPENVLMINSRFDHYFSKKSTKELWEALGKPRIYWFNRLHTSKLILNPRIFEKIYEFITR